MLNAGLTRGNEGTAERTRISPFDTVFPHRFNAAALFFLTIALAGCVSGSVLEPPLPIPDPSGRPPEAGAYAPADDGPGNRLFAGRSSAVSQSPLPPPPAPGGTGYPAAAETRRTVAASTPPSIDRSPPATQRAHAFPADTAAGSSPLAARNAPAGARTTSAATIRFTPVIGAPVDAIRPLSEALENSAEKHGIAIQTTADSPPDNILRGYFSASKSGSGTDIVYVWDILDSRGQQLYRLEGTKTVANAGGGADPWSGVPASAMRAIARRTIADYLGWRASKSG